jgi:hypothetical protein
VVGYYRIRHDGSRIGVDQRHLNALVPQRPGCLRARIIKFAGLSNDDGAAAYDEDRFEGWILGHGGAFCWIRLNNAAKGRKEVKITHKKKVLQKQHLSYTGSMHYPL